MLIDRYPVEDVFARVPKLAALTDPVLDDDPLFQLVKTDLSHRYPKTGHHGRHSTPAVVILRLLVVQLVIPRADPLSPAQRARERDRGWRRRYHWRAGIEGRISSLRRDYGLRRCPAHGEDGMVQHIGWGVIASDLRHIGQHPAAA